MPKASVFFSSSIFLFVNPKDVQIRGQNLLRLLFVSFFFICFWGVFLDLFSKLFVISNIVKCKFIHVNVCFDWFCYFFHVSFADFFSIRRFHQICLVFANCCCCCHVHLFFFLGYGVDLVFWHIVRGINILRHHC